MDHNSSLKTLAQCNSTKQRPSPEQPKTGRYTSSILTLQALRGISINFVLAISVLYKTELLRELSN